MQNNILKKGLPAVVLMVIAPLIAEILPGSTRFSSIFVFPIEVLVWGGGALLIRYVVTKWQLGWINMLFLALALSLAEEFLIQQTSVAPMVLQLKGITYARSLGINYVYLLWALIYESVFVVFLPISLTEIIFQSRNKELWIGKGGILITIVLFLLGSFMAWYTWTQIARPAVYHVQAYNPPISVILIAITLIGFFIFAAVGSFRHKLVYLPSLLNPPSYRVIMIIGGLWSVVQYGIVLLAFGISPSFPPVIAIGINLMLVIAPVYFIPRWRVSQQWQTKHVFSIVFGVMLGSMMAPFIGFIGGAKADLYFKIIINLLAVILMIALGFKINRKLN